VSHPLEEAYVEKIEAVVRDLADRSPVVSKLTPGLLIGEWSIQHVCSLCLAKAADPINVPHTDSCPWRRARELQP